MERVCKKALPGLTMADGRQTESMADIPMTVSEVQNEVTPCRVCEPRGHGAPGGHGQGTVGLEKNSVLEPWPKSALEMQL